MSTKKEKPCCDRCREVSSISGSFNCVGTCQCHQSESIEWEKEFNKEFTGELWLCCGEPDCEACSGDFSERASIKDFIQKAITTAVAKEKKSETLAFERGAVYGAMRVKKELAEEVEKMSEVGHEPTNDSVENARREKWNLIITGKNIVVEKVLSLLKH